ncbi:hypothetical protein Hdeb2414_s0011g00376271 [Helianthus debilis subsp. tardiflorus]
MIRRFLIPHEALCSNRARRSPLSTNRRKENQLRRKENYLTLIVKLILTAMTLIMIVASLEIKEPYRLVGSAFSDPLDKYKRKIPLLINNGGG